LQRLELTGALVTIDAMGTQTEIAQTIIDRRRRLPAVTQAKPPGHLRRSGDVLRQSTTRRGAATQGDSRIETRQYIVCHDVDWLFSDRRYPGEPVFPGLAMIGMISSKIERAGKTEGETRYYLGSARLDADTFACAVRGHWGIENRLHWVLDVIFHDDLARLRTGFGPQNMAVIKHTALNLLSAAKPTVSTAGNAPGGTPTTSPLSSAEPLSSFTRFPCPPWAAGLSTTSRTSLSVRSRTPRM
jgi:predicted transposase YbfD/YdcC